jgi:hypothetical protein
MRRQERVSMTYVIAMLIALCAGWSVTACESLFRAEQRPGIFHGTAGMILLLVVAGVGGLLLAGALIWVLRIVPSASVALILGIGAVLGGMASNKLNLNAAGAANRTLVGLAGLAILYSIAWTFYPPEKPLEPSAPVDLQRTF